MRGVGIGSSIGLRRTSQTPGRSPGPPRHLDRSDSEGRLHVAKSSGLPPQSGKCRARSEPRGPHNPPLMRQSSSRRCLRLPHQLSRTVLYSIRLHQLSLDGYDPSTVRYLLQTLGRYTSMDSLPPYVAYRTFRSFIQLLSPAVPGRIDRSLMASMSGASQSQLIHALRCLRLI